MVLCRYLTFTGNNIFNAVDPTVSGVYIDGDVRAMTSIKNNSGEELVIIAKNNESVQVLKRVQQ